jgi:hypothetical protein
MSLYGCLFYSYRDNGFCQNLITLMNKYGLNKMFKYELVDNMSDEQLMKLQLQKVPTLLVISDDGQSKKQYIYPGNEAFKWVDGFLISQKQKALKNAENSRKLIQNSNAKEKIMHRLYEYCPAEHAGISDGYAYYNEDENKDRQSTVAQGKTFSYGFSTENENIGAIPVGKISEYRAKEGISALYGNEDSFKKAINRANEERKKQDDAFKNNMEKDVIKTIVQKSASNNQ